jgi:hypothetical protein
LAFFCRAKSVLIDVDELQSMPQMAVLPSAPGAAAASAAGPLKAEPQKPFEQEKVELEICTVKSVVNDAEARILGKSPSRSHSD